MLRTKTIRRGKWRTVESFWNAKASAFFRQPSGAHIKVRYGIGWLGRDGQKQQLNGAAYKKLDVGFGSIARARMQVRVGDTADVTYDVYPGGLAATSPEIEF